MIAKTCDLAGPGIGDCSEVEEIVPRDYHSFLSP